MSRVIYRPARERQWSSRFFVGLRLAWLHRDGTIIEHRGQHWEKVHDYDTDAWGWWQPVPAPSLSSPTD